MSVLNKIDAFLWGIPVLFLVLAGGLYYTVRLRFMPVRRLGEALCLTFGAGRKKGGQNRNENTGGNSGKAAKDTKVSPFGALCTSLAACLGTGNIVGVALAVKTGGPGTIFWMVTAAFLGMSVMYAECFLAVRFRERRADQTGYGGPFLYIVKGMGEKWRPLAALFAVSGMCGGLLGIGTFAQTNSIAQAAEVFFDPERQHHIRIPFAGEHSIAVVIVSVLITAAAAAVLLGGIKRIAAFAQVVVPFMALGFGGICLGILLFGAEKLPAAFAQILQGAFCPKAVFGGGAVSAWTVIRIGVSRGIFSNEAGMGSAPLAAAASDEDSPRLQGLVSMTGTFIDTVVMCTLTGLVLVVTDAWKAEGVQGAALTVYAVQKGLGIGSRAASAIVMAGLSFFAFTSILGWNHYAVSCLEFLTGGGARMQFQLLYILAVFLGFYLSVDVVWVLADIFNACMAIPNMTALWALRRQVEYDLP